jgi:hypothetical protein
MKQTLWIILAFFLVVSGRPQGVPVYKKNSAGILLSELPFLDIRLNYEHRLALQHGVRLELGYKPAWKRVKEFSDFEVPEKMTGLRYGACASWFYISGGYRFYFGLDKSNFISAELFYKYIWAEKIIYIDAPSSSYRTHDQRSLSTNMTGLNLLVGKRVELTLKEKTSAGLEFFGGIGGRLKYQEVTIYGEAISYSGWDSPPDAIAIPLTGTPEITRDTYLQPSLLLGISFYFNW